ncbi:MAG: hypothetical protein AB7S38_24100 [Vulcanimicrobiota bacterium]
MGHYQGFYRSRMCCHDCDQELEFQGDVKKSVKTKLGQIQIQRAYHGDCGHSAVPLDLLRA